MPGLMGVVDPLGKLGKDAISRDLDTMAAAVTHAPSYVTKKHVDGCWGVAGVFLPAWANAPCPFKRKPGEHLFIDGELYRLNGRDVLGDDYFPELASGLAEKPRETLNNSDGSFLLVYENTLAGELILANDVTGGRACYYLWDDGVLYFAPEVKALLAVRPDAAEVSEQAIANYLASGIPYFDETYFKRIKCLRPSSILRMSLANGRTTHEKYWSFRFNEDARDAGAEEYSRELIRLIDRAVARRTRDAGKRRTALSLSGGYDSRSILGACLRQGISLGTVTHGVDRDAPETDAAVVKAMCAKLGISNRFIKLTPENLADHFAENVFLSDASHDQLVNFSDGLNAYREVGNDYDTLIRGDELYGYLGAPFNESEALALAGYIKLPQQYRAIMPEEQFERFEKLSVAGLDLLSRNCPNKELTNRKDFFVFHEQVPNVLNRLNHIKQMCVNIRNPHIDREILDFVANLPPKHRLFRKLFVRSVTSANPEVFAFEYAAQNSLPNMKKTYSESQKMRDFVCHTFFDAGNNFFDEFTDKEKLRAFLERYKSEATAARPEPTPGVRGKGVRAFATFEIKNNYWLYKLCLPLLKYRQAHSNWLDSSYILIRLLVLKIWSDNLLKQSALPKK